MARLRRLRDRTARLLNQPASLGDVLEGGLVSAFVASGEWVMAAILAVLWLGNRWDALNIVKEPG